MITWHGVVLFVVCVSPVMAHMNSIDVEELCDRIVCRPGRECRLQANGIPGCQCIRKCPDHYSPVCGTNSLSYDNHCELHRDACHTGEHISIRHRGYCERDRKWLMQEQQYRNKEEEKKIRDKPIVCFQHERDRLREHIVHNFKLHREGYSWYTPGMTYAETLWGRYYTCDVNRDNFLDANEFLECVKNVTTPVRRGENAELVRALCIDAIIDAGDANSDWRLEYEEFKNLMQESFKAEKKMCSLEGKHYEDGAEANVDCNECICACGNWVCTSNKCDDDYDDFEDDFDDDDDDDENDAYDDGLMGSDEWRHLLRDPRHDNL